MDRLCFLLSCVCYAFVHVCLFVPCGHLLDKLQLSLDFVSSLVEPRKRLNSTAKVLTRI